MSGRTILVVAIALACGLLAAVGIGVMNKNGAPTAAVETRPVVYVAADIRRGDPVPREALEVRQLPKAIAPASALEKIEDVEGRVARIAMLKEDVVTDAKLEAKGVKSRVVPPGHLAFTVTASYANPLQPDDHVDVYFTTNGGAGAAAIAPLKDVPVWDLPPQSAGAPGSGSGSVILLVDPEQAAVLNQGMSSGTLRLASRNPRDHVTPAAPEPAPPPPPPAPPSTDLASRIPPGMQAYTIDAPGSSATMAGMLVPGHRVDVFCTRRGRAQAGGGGGLTSGIMDALKGPEPPPQVEEPPGTPPTIRVADVEILAVNNATDREAAAQIDPEDVRTITLAVRPAQARVLEEGQITRTLHLTLRREGDHSVEPEPEPPPALRLRQATTTTRTLRGTATGNDRMTVYWMEPGPAPAGRR